jgi:hypothetical protein
MAAAGRNARQDDAGDDNRWSDGPPLPRWALWLMLPGIVGPVLIFGFILWTQRAHDPTRCPYHELARRTLGADLVVIEDARHCVSDVQEHRYSVLRAGQRRVLGERRFDAQAFVAGDYVWRVEQTAQGEVQVVVHNPGHDDVLFREGTPEEHLKGISKGHVRAPGRPAGSAGAP